MDSIYIFIAKDYTTMPGVRTEEEGTYSGEDFLEKILLPKYKQAVDENKVLVINLDGTEGYATSFLEAAFGGLAREERKSKIIKRKIKFVSNDDPYIVDDINEYIDKANVK